MLSNRDIQTQRRGLPLCDHSMRWTVGSEQTSQQVASWHLRFVVIFLDGQPFTKRQAESLGRKIAGAQADVVPKAVKRPPHIAVYAKLLNFLPPLQSTILCYMSHQPTTFHSSLPSSTCTSFDLLVVSSNNCLSFRTTFSETRSDHVDQDAQSRDRPHRSQLP